MSELNDEIFLGETTARSRGKYCDSEVEVTYEQSAWYEPLLMIDLLKGNGVDVAYGVVVDEFVDIADDECGWMVGCEKVKEGRKWE